MKSVTRSPTAATGVAPDFPSASASTARRAHWNVQWNRGAGARLMPRQADFGAHAIAAGVRLDEGLPHPLDLVADSGEINRHFVGKRPSNLPIGRRTSLDGNPGMVNAPVVLHSLVP
jgi:hypothetical protein